MNIWQWVRETREQLYNDEEHRLADLMDRIPSLACDDEHAELDAAVPEALAHARRLGLDWAELFIRHWNLQSKILHRMETGEYLSEAIDLLEFAHRDGIKDCPQSVCTTQDLAVAYAQRDDKGYVDERLAVASETLSRIDPNWQCFECISNEYSGALLDDGRAQEALDFLDEQVEALVATCPPRVVEYRKDGFNGNRIGALIDLGRLEEALEIAQADITRLEHEGIQRHRLVHRKLSAAKILAKLGRGEEGLECLPPWEVIVETPTFYRSAAKALDALLEAETVENSWLLGRRVWVMARRLAGNGAVRGAVELSLMHARHALDRQQPEIARRSLDLLTAELPKLRKPYEDMQTVEALEQRQRTMLQDQEEETESYEDASQIFDQLLGDPELDMQLFRAGLKQFPDEDDLLFSLANALDAVGFDGDAHAALEQGYRAFPTIDRLMRLSTALMDAQEFDKIEHLIAELADAPDEMGAGAHWMLAQLRWKQGVLDEAIDALAVVIDSQPEWSGARPMRAHLLRQEGRYEEAIAMLDAQLEQFETEDVPLQNIHWDRMVVATMQEDWERVHASARAIGFQFDTEEGPIDEPFQMCLVTFSQEPDAPTYWAVRNSPVTAKVVEIARTRRAQHFEDEVIFEPSSLTPRPEDHPEDQPHHDTYTVLAVRQKGDFHDSFTLHGVCPPEEQLEALQQGLLDELGVASEHVPTQGYMLHDPESDAPLEALYMMLAVPRDADLEAVHAYLAEHTKELEHPLEWSRLLEKMNAREELIAEHEAIHERYGMLDD
jgi:tetratricopeptide (TPR) repeat protein